MSYGKSVQTAEGGSTILFYNVVSSKFVVENNF